MSSAAVRTHELSKRYVLGLGNRGYASLRESIASATRRAAGRVTRASPPGTRTSLWALRDLSLTIDQGEVVGLIGHNGAGKSTLLKILSRITEPTAGHADVTGRVGSLLEVGTGFHPELTGRENVFLNGAILGMRRTEIRRRFDEIVAFSEIERFLDTPVKRYSSGMSVRLAFAVAAHLETEILLVDEVLAVGDAAFQRKSLGKMNAVSQEGRTVIFVSHNLAIIQALCQRGVLLEHGRVVADGSVNETIDHYLHALEDTAGVRLLERSDRDQRGWRQTLIAGVNVEDVRGGHSDAVVAGRPMTITVHVTELLPTLECRLTITNSLGHPVSTLDTEVSAPGDLREGSQPIIACQIEKVSLLPGRYRLDVTIKARNQIQDGLVGAAFFNVEPGMMDDRPLPADVLEGDVALVHTWRLPAVSA